MLRWFCGRLTALTGTITLCLLTGVATAAELAVVIDDLGYSSRQAERVLALPVPVTLALLPFAPATAEVARRALETGHELILHQPMEPLPREHLPPAIGMLTSDMSAELFDAQMLASLAAVPGIVGVNNHTGSRLTQDPAAMRRLMQRLAEHGLLFLDSRTTAATVAYRTARESGVPALQRDVFLDHRPEPDAIAGEFVRALAIARRRGQAVVIAHPYEVTLTFLGDALGHLPDDVRVVPLAALVSRSRPATLALREDPASPHRSLGQ
jgi:polysaccharide deacetylase 2 family uncharacterized protein YibQ